MCQLRLRWRCSPLSVVPSKLGFVTDPAPPTPAHALGAAQGSALYVGAVLGTGVIALPGAGRARGRAGVADRVARPGRALRPARRHLRGAGRSLPGRRRRLHLRPARVRCRPRRYSSAGASTSRSRSAGPPRRCSAAVTSRPRVGGGRTTTVAVAAVTLVAVAAANASGLQVSARLQLVLAGVLLALMVVSVVVALPHARIAAPAPVRAARLGRDRRRRRAAGLELRRLGGDHAPGGRVPPSRARPRPRHRRGCSSWSACSTWLSRSPRSPCSGRRRPPRGRRWPTCSSFGISGGARYVAAVDGRAADGRGR